MIASWWARVRGWRTTAAAYLAVGVAGWDALSMLQLVGWMRPQVHSLLITAIVLSWLESRFHSSVMAYRFGYKAGRLDQQGECADAHGLRPAAGGEDDTGALLARRRESRRRGMIGAAVGRSPVTPLYRR
jgi:hypothetical protein